MALESERKLMAAIAATRFGLGARPGEIDAAMNDPRAFLKAQIRVEGAEQPTGELKSSSDNLFVYDGLRKARQAAKAEALSAIGPPSSRPGCSNPETQPRPWTCAPCSRACWSSIWAWIDEPWIPSFSPTAAPSRPPWAWWLKALSKPLKTRPAACST